ncbi:MAG: UDP-2,4-diacetamido-2,4,6-trideoxy-beta-L-altropyranose hydrolase [Lachnospiraceae bacterium]|nr:UDP-2,4-diacetamido-2,4,6-trideoxy-beta-L-altropyranose hydrolase [Lachnospiraceae bacterium]
MKKILAVIPARAGSKGIPKKNIRMMAGKPLISYAVENALNSKFITDVVVSTDSDEVKTIVSKLDVNVIDRPEFLCEDNVTLDSVIYHAYETMKLKKDFDIIVTLQPTSPLLKTETLDAAIEEHIEKNMDTTISVVNKPHLAWGEKNGTIIPLYEKRVNRQYLPPYYSETGAFVITNSEFVKKESRFGKRLGVFEMSQNESIDIDNRQDWVLAEAELNKKKIIFRVDGYKEIGMGHIYRTLQIAYNLTEHEVLFVLSSNSEPGINKIKNSFFRYEIVNTNEEIIDIIERENADILVNDILDTDKDYMLLVKQLGIRVVNFEDLGEGRLYADAVINALYEKQENPNTYCGEKYYCVRDEFILFNDKRFSENVKNVLIVFGGTDPENLTMKVINAIEKTGHKEIQYTCILGLGYGDESPILEKVKDMDYSVKILRNVNNIAEYMYQADIAISSQGRTMYELACMKVPTIIIAQNEREQTHYFGDIANGFINLGLGTEIDEPTITETLKWLIKSEVIRKNLYRRMKDKDFTMGIKRVKRIVLGD